MRTSTLPGQPASSRFTAYLGDQERERVRQLARREDCSENYVIRLAVRVMVGLPVPPRVADRVLELTRDLQQPSA